jgi:hypothetical protein
LPLLPALLSDDLAGEHHLAADEVEQRTSNSSFVRLWNQMWRKAGVPKTIAAIKGCWLDLMFERHQVPVVWSDRLDAGRHHHKLRKTRDQRPSGR